MRLNSSHGTQESFYDDREATGMTRGGRNPGKRGARFENEVKDDLEARGWYAVRSAGSHGVTDVLAYHMGTALFVQCKKGGDFPPGERHELLYAARKHNAIAIMADKRERGVIRYRRLLTDHTDELFCTVDVK